MGHIVGACRYDLCKCSYWESVALMAEKMITEAQKRAIRQSTRAANRRLERATEGQRAALQKYIGAEKFSSATKGMNYQQAAAQIEKLNKFLDAKSSTRKGWKEIKEKSIANANKTLTLQGYNLTDEELADILEQLEDNRKQDFYRAVNLVSAEKAETGDDWAGTTAQITAAIEQKASYQEALTRALKARENR